MNLTLYILQIFEVAPSLHMVELRKTGGDTLEYHKACVPFLSENSTMADFSCLFQKDAYVLANLASFLLKFMLK